jgi:hypothetical protein
MVHSRSRAYTPNLDPNKFAIRSVSLRRLERTVEDYRVRSGEPDSSRVVYLVASGLDFLRYYRTDLEESVEAWDSLRENSIRFRRIKSFEAHFLNRSFYESLDPMFASYFVSPDIEFYEYLGPGGAPPDARPVN